MSKSPVTRIENNTGKVLATGVLLAVCTLPMSWYVYNVLAQTQDPKKTLIAVTVTTVIAAVTMLIYWGAHKLMPTQFYSLDEIDQCYRKSILGKGLNTLGAYVFYLKLASVVAFAVVLFYALIWGR